MSNESNLPNHSGSPQSGYSYPSVNARTITYNEEHHGDTFGDNTTVDWTSRDRYVYQDNVSPPQTQATQTSYTNGSRDPVPPPHYQQHQPQT
ncbi:hypothetical protein PQX77_018499, partial [Marasmius sp. AFHP31]